MTFLHYLRDQLRLILCWFMFIGATVLVIWLTPNAPFNLASMIYLSLIGSVILFSYFSMDYTRKRKWWAQLEQQEEIDIGQPNLEKAFSHEERLYQSYFNNLHQEHFLLLNNVQQQAQEQKDYIDSWVHEIKIPLASLSLITENIEDDISDKRYLQLRENIHRMDDYVEQVMYYSRLDSFSKDYLIRSYSLKQLVQNIVRHSSHLFIEKNIRFDLIGEDRRVLTDDKWLTFILNQLLGNALKYTYPNGQITVAISHNERGSWLILTDSGIGIPAEDLRRIFDKGFTGTNGRNEEVNSTGLGLYLAKNLTEKLGHQLFVESIVGTGTTVTLLFPTLAYYNESDDSSFISKS